MLARLMKSLILLRFDKKENARQILRPETEVNTQKRRASKIVGQFSVKLQRVFFTFFKSTDDVSVNLGHACAFDEIVDFA
jgi:hypothetical protein